MLRGRGQTVVVATGMNPVPINSTPRPGFDDVAIAVRGLTARRAAARRIVGDDLLSDRKRTA